MTRAKRWRWAAAAWAVAAAAVPAAERAPQRLPLLGADYPRVFFFRAAEGAARRATDYAAWDAEYGRLMGIMGKCLDEEIVGHTARNPEYFSRFKAAHPSQAVLLHFNGNARDPRFEAASFFPGHWIYREATPIAADVPAEDGETEIRVKDVSDFKTGGGRYRISNDDIALFGITPAGTHDWAHCEQVQLVSVDANAGTIRVKRGCYGTRPLAFKAGAARAAAHAVEGPWGKTNHLLWFYNYATHCPRDPQGKTCADRLCDDLARWFGPGGSLAALDGLEFDVLFNETRGDTDGDGRADDGIAGGLNRYGLGVIEFARRLRERMGPGFILQADGALGPGGERSQRAFGFFNGMESEGWPNLGDWDFEDWSGGLNRLAFWRDNAHPPAFSYINHKWTQGVAGRPGEVESPDVPFARHRLVFAAAQVADAMLCYAFTPPRGGGRELGIWDEFIGGAGGKPGWLGRPEGPAVRLAETTPDLLVGTPWASRVAGDVTVRETAGAWAIQPKDPSAKKVSLTIPDVRTRGSNLVVFVTMSAAPMEGYPASMARFAELEVSGGEVVFVDREPDATSMTSRGGAEGPIDRATGASLSFRPRYEVNGVTLPAIFVHPPYRGAKGSVSWCRDATVFADAELRFQLGMSELAPQRSDGVWFQVWAAPVKGGKPGEFRRIFEGSSKEFRWLPRSVPLREWAGQTVRFKFVADCGPKDNATTDQAAWGDVRIVRAGAGGTTRPQRLMTWAGGRDFTSSFYFRHVGGPSVDLRLTVEGREAVVLKSVRAHAAPDAVARVFERGLVLANPSVEPFTFDLRALSPGRSYERIRATRGQDGAANNGEPVGATVTLGGRDALFLRRAP